MSDYQLVRIGVDEKSDFLVAWEAAFNRQLNSLVYEWIFDENNIVYVLKLDGDIVAGYCLYPVECRWIGKRRTALLCNNVFVCPGHQGKHLFVKISKAALADASAKSYGSVAYGVPNSLALPGHKRVGWGVQEPVFFLEKTISYKKSEMGNQWSYGKLEQSDRKEMAACSQLSAKNRDFSIIKSEEFIKWRYESKPGVGYWFGFKEEGGELLAYCVCKFFSDKNTVHVIDVDGISDDAVASLIDDIEGLPEGFDKVNVWSSTAKKAVFLNKGYKHSGDFDNFIMMDVERLGSVYLNENINLCLGDNDVY
tara:strand:- start:93 stop:1019 length:927 start_codon:yes stop_codon:yes gene_type:complete